MRSRRHKSWLRKISKRLTFNKLTFGKGRQPRRSRRLHEHQAEYSPDTPSFLTQLLSWLGNRVAWIVAGWALIMLLYLGFGTKWFYIYEIELEGTNRLTKEEIYNQSKLEAWSMFWFNGNAIATLVEEHPLVAEAVASPLLPNKVRIEITERIPVAVWQSEETCYFVDSEGVLFDLRTPLEQLPIIHDKSATPMNKENKVDPVVIRTVQELSQLMTERNEFEWRPDVGIFFTTEEEWQVIFGDYTHLKTKVAAYRAFMKQRDPERELLWLNLSMPKKPYFSEVDTSTSEP